MSQCTNNREIPSELLNVSSKEYQLHQNLVIRNIDFLVTLLAADQELQPWAPTNGCPDSTPERVARKRGDSDTFPCLYKTVDRSGGSVEPRVQTRFESSCLCEDPLAGSNDPLDAVAAIVLATNEQTIADRYVNRRWRAVVAKLREQYGTWDKLAQLSKADLVQAVEAARGSSVSDARITRLHDLLVQLTADNRFDLVTLQGLAPRPYSSFHNLLVSFPGVSKRDAWWLLLTAFDKPVWPVDPAIDRLLCDLGLLTPDEVGNGDRHESLEEALVDRQIPALHRALAGHAARGQTHFASEGCELQKFSLTYRARQQAKLHDQDRPVVVDLFAGAGGLSHGFLRAKYTIALAVDNNRQATDTYRLNHPQIPHDRVKCTDIEKLLERDDWPALLPDSPDIMIGGPPCQSLSLAGYRSRRADDSDYSIRDDPRTELYTRYLDAVNDLRPKALILENVEGMASEIGDTEERVVDQIIEDLGSADEDGGPAYVADFRAIDCSKFGIPQTRNRIIIFGIREDLAQRGITPESFFQVLNERSFDQDDQDPYSLRQGLAGLPRLCRGEGGDVVLGKPRGPLSNYVEDNELATSTDLSFNHRTREHPMEKDQKLFEIMDPGDTGWHVKYEKEDGKWGHLIEYYVGTREEPAFTDKYRMIHWNKPAPTVVAHFAKDTNNYIIPDYYEYANPDDERKDTTRNRGVTPREAARLQSFPDDYIFLGPFTSQFRQIGNAVPPVLAWHLGVVIRKTILDITDMAPVESSTTGSQAISSDD